MLQFTGRVGRVKFRNDDGFVIFNFKTETEGDEVSLDQDISSFTCKGTVVGVEIREGADLIIRGDWGKPHPKYGPNFEVKLVSECEPSDTQGICRYLVANIKGVGWATALKVANRFGEKTVSILLQSPDRIYECVDIPEGLRQVIHTTLQENVVYRDLSIFLNSLDVSESYVRQIYATLGNDAIEKLKKDPYLLMDVRGIGFKSADEVAVRMGYRTLDPARIRACIRNALEEQAPQNGHLYLTYPSLFKLVEKLAPKVSDSAVKTALKELRTKGTITIQGKLVYATRYYFYETESVKKLSKLLLPVEHSKFDVEEYIEWYQKAHSITFSTNQAEAVRTAAKSKVMILTGGPGTGKTTVSRAIVTMYERILGEKAICLMAPTGIAAKRLAKATGRSAGTIHRTLGGGGDTWARDCDKPMDEKFVLTDEVSMMDMELFYRLLDALREDSYLVLVGDDAQLPSVGPGNVLRELLKSGVIPSVKLLQIHRQAATSDIVLNAHRINSGEPIEVTNTQTSDFKFVALREERKIRTQIRKIAKALHDKGLDFQCMSPRYKGIVGVNSLNELLREDLNPDIGQPQIQIGSKTFRVGDRVMVTQNNYEHSVFNGDRGTVVQVDTKARTVQFTVEGNGEPVTFESHEAMSDLTLAYCVTIHKVQGDEYDMIIMPWIKGFSIQLVRNLLYTGLTRAKKGAFILGHREAIDKAIQNNTVRTRNTALAFRLQKIST